MLYHCIIVDCGPPPDLANGSITRILDTLENHTVKYECNEGYTFDGIDEVPILCMPNGSWSLIGRKCLSKTQ